MKSLFWNSNHCTCCCQTKESKEGPFLEVQARSWQKTVGMAHHAANRESLSTWRPFIVAIFFLAESKIQIPNETSTPNMNHIFTKAKTGKGAQTAKHWSQHRKWELVYFEQQPLQGNRASSDKCWGAEALVARIDLFLEQVCRRLEFRTCQWLRRRQQMVECRVDAFRTWISRLAHSTNAVTETSIPSAYDEVFQQ